MNLKYLLLTVALLPTLSCADTPVQPAEKTTMQKVKEFMTLKRVAIGSGVGGLAGIAGGFIGFIFAGEAANKAVDPHIKMNVHSNIRDASIQFILFSTQKKGLEYDGRNIPPCTDAAFLKYQLITRLMLGVIAAGGALAVTCLGTLTYALIKKLTSKPEDEQKSATAAGA